MKAHELASRINPESVPLQRDDSQQPSPDKASDGASFADALEKAQQRRSEPATEVDLSAHAEQRIEQRNISLNEMERQSLGEAMHQLEDKGSRDALLLRSDAAFIVNVPDRTVVTAMDQNELEEQIFTDIDSAMLV